MPHLQQHTCRSCSAPLAFLPGTLAVRCDSCGSVAHVVSSDRSANTRDSSTTFADRSSPPHSPISGSAATPVGTPPADRYESLLHELGRKRALVAGAATVRNRWTWTAIVGAFCGIAGLSQANASWRGSIPLGLAGSVLAAAAGWSALRAHRRTAVLVSELSDLDTRANAAQTAHGLNAPASLAPPPGAADRPSPTLAWGTAIMGALVGKGNVAPKRPPR